MIGNDHLPRSSRTLLAGQLPLLAIALLLLSACKGLTVHITSTTSINSDGSGTRVVTVAINEAVYAISQAAGDPFGKARLIADAAGAHLDEFKVGFEGVKVTKEFASLTELAQLSSGSRLFSQLDRVDGQVQGSATTLHVQVNPPALQFAGQRLDVSSLADFTYTITVPGRLVSSNADRVAGNSATWQLASVTAPKQLSVSWTPAAARPSSATGLPGLAVIVVGLLLVVGLVLGAFLWGQRRGKIGAVVRQAHPDVVCPTCGYRSAGNQRYCPRDGSALALLPVQMLSDRNG